MTLLLAPALDPPAEVESQPPFGAEPLPITVPSPPPARLWQPPRRLSIPRDTAAVPRSATLSYLVERELRINGLAPTQMARPQPERRLLAPRETRPAVADEPVHRVTAWSATRLFVGMCVEVLNGYRPVGQLRPMSDPHRFTDIADQVVRRTVRVRMSPTQAARQGRLVRVRRLLVSEPLPGIAEAAVVLEQGTACWSMALRMERDSREGTSTTWRCVLVQVI